MRRILVVLAALLLLLCSCSDTGSNPRAKTVTKVSGPADTVLPKQIVFAIDSGADEIMVSAAESFCRKVNSLSKSSLIFTLIKSGDPLAEFESGNAGFILLSGDKAVLLHPYFAITNERFRYSGYENFSMICNSSRVLGKLSDVSGSKVFAAYYTGSNVFAGLAPLDEMFAVDRKAESDASPLEIELFTIPDSGTDAAFKIPAVASAKSASLPERTKMLYSDDTVVELAFSELLPSQISAAVPPVAAVSSGDVPDNVSGGTPDDASGGMSGERESIVITRTFHSIAPTWLIIAPSLYETLTPLDRAAVDEAAAFIPNSFDREYLKLEQERLDMLEEDGILISNDFSSTRMKILRARNESAKEIPAGEKYFRDLLGRI